MPSSTSSLTDLFAQFHTPSGLAYSRLVLDLLRVSARLTVAGDALAREFGLSEARWMVMGAIRDGGRSISDIARDRGLTRQSVQETVSGMARQKLVTLIPSADDRRVKLVRLTAQGSKLFTALTERWAQQANRLARSFTQADMAGAGDVIRRIGTAIDTL